ncbi:MAG: LytTR family DNA-binding domain-containing protein [Bacteroidota bacterium]
MVNFNDAKLCSFAAWPNVESCAKPVIHRLFYSNSEFFRLFEIYMLKTKRILIHISYWLICGLFLGGFIGIRDGNFMLTLILTGLLLPVAISTSYTFNYYLFPKLLFKEQYVKFSIYGLLTVVLSLYLKVLFVLAILAFMADNQFNNMPEVASNMFSLGIVLYFIVFLGAIIHLIKGNHMKVSKPDKAMTTHLQVRANRQNVKLSISDIIYIESLSDYVQIHADDKVVITKEKISKISERLPVEFVRIHRSYIVNSMKIESFTREKVQVKSEILPISRTYKQQVMKKLSA